MSMGFPRQEYWSWLPFPTPAGIPDPGTESVSPALAGRLFTTAATWEAPVYLKTLKNLPQESLSFFFFFCLNSWQSFSC